MVDDVKLEAPQDPWYKRAAKATWDGTKSIGTAIKENPGSATIGAVVGLVVAGPPGAVLGAGAGGWIGKKNNQ